MEGCDDDRWGRDGTQICMRASGPLPCVPDPLVADLAAKGTGGSAAGSICEPGHCEPQTGGVGWGGPQAAGRGPRAAGRGPRVFGNGDTYITI
jgi:hypothetical protein